MCDLELFANFPIFVLFILSDVTAVFLSSSLCGFVTAACSPKLLINLLDVTVLRQRKVRCME